MLEIRVRNFSRKVRKVQNHICSNIPLRKRSKSGSEKKKGEILEIQLGNMKNARTAAEGGPMNLTFDKF